MEDKFSIKEWRIDRTLLNEGEIDYDKEKSWRIKDQFPIKGYVKKGWTSRYYVIDFPEMAMSYETAQDIDDQEHMTLGLTSYDYKNGEASFTADTIDQIKSWESEHRDKIKIDYSRAEEIWEEKNINEEEGEGIYAGIKFPIDNMQDLNNFYKINYKEVVGEDEDRDLEDIASGDRAADLEEEMFARDIISYMKNGAFKNSKIAEEYLDSLTQEYYG